MFSPWWFRCHFSSLTYTTLIKHIRLVLPYGISKLCSILGYLDSYTHAWHGYISKCLTPLCYEKFQLFWPKMRCPSVGVHNWVSSTRVNWRLHVSKVLLHIITCVKDSQIFVPWQADMKFLKLYSTITSIVTCKSSVDSRLNS